MEKGKHYVLFIPPGWLLGATVADVSDGIVTLRDAIYIEGIAQESVFAAAAAKNAKIRAGVIRQSWPIPDGTRVRADAILIATPAVCSFSAEARATEAAAIKSTR